MQFESFHWLAIMGYEPLYHALRYGKRTRDFFEAFLLFFSLVCYVFGALVE